MKNLRFGLLLSTTLAAAACSSSAIMPNLVGSDATSSSAPLSAQQIASSGSRLATVAYASARGRDTGLRLNALPAPLRALPAAGSFLAPSATAFCSFSTPGVAACPVRVRTDIKKQSAGTPVAFLSGLTPGDMNTIYNLGAFSPTAGAGRTIAIVVAGDDAAAESDLSVYRTAFGLSACTTSNGCFKKIAQNGSRTYPPAIAGWTIETATDVDTISAVCPGCNITVVEAQSASIADLAVAVDAAVASGANVVSNSYGVAEASDNVQFDGHYHHPGVAIVAAAGDAGYGVTFPASSPNVIAVGGTTLYQTNGTFNEVAWSQSNSGCSAFFAKPSWQKDKGCSKRTMNDLAVIADPSDGMAVYDSTLDGTSGGWTVVGGTSIGAPIVSSMIATQPNPGNYFTAQQLYENNGKNVFFPITAGSNGTCLVPYFCTAGKGYSAPTGLGSPNGPQAFQA